MGGFHARTSFFALWRGLFLGFGNSLLHRASLPSRRLTGFPSRLRGLWPLRLPNLRHSGGRQFRHGRPRQRLVFFFGIRPEVLYALVEAPGEVVIFFELIFVAHPVGSFVPAHFLTSCCLQGTGSRAHG